MRNYQLKITVMLVTLVFFGLLVKSSPDKNLAFEELEGAALRQPASTPVPVALEDVYEFDRRMKAVLNQQEVLSDIHYSGHLFIQWKEINKTSRIGLFSFQINSSTKQETVFAEAEISNDYELISLKTSKTKNEDEENSILFLKDLISIYAFKTFEDTSGKYLANVKMITSSNDVKIFIKNKLNYSDSSLALLKFNKSVHEIKLSEQLVEATGFEETQMGSELKTTSVYRLKKTSIIKGMLTKQNPINSKSTLELTTLKVSPISYKEPALSKQELENMLASAVSLNGKARLRFFHELVKSLENDPDAFESFKSWMISNAGNSKNLTMAIGVLAAIGTDQAQHELVQLYHQSKNNSESTAHLILNSIATSGVKASPEMIGLMTSALDNKIDNPELAINAAYALGAIGEVKKITEMANQATSKDEKIIFIDAMGNSGSVDTLPFLLENVESSDAQIREKAIFALRFVNDQRVKKVFEKSMFDSSVDVRVSVVKAVPFQPNPQDYEVLLKNCANQSLVLNLKALCSQTLSNI